MSGPRLRVNNRCYGIRLPVSPSRGHTPFTDKLQPIAATVAPTDEVVVEAKSLAKTLREMLSGKYRNPRRCNLFEISMCAPSISFDEHTHRSIPTALRTPQFTNLPGTTLSRTI